ncbi:hypothetical protein H8790_04715 [Oscillibacter hominis]|uniref:DUF5044 domain-containing protein n=1 Tax=Oscillibacter hominis TaxID=2763056 RepID=A0A7G9B6Z1_9FIRM|nr:hypothetical protein [Oscillibacter hominis]QNL45322.1 hypothetical protein H8790_04715 [Oscillibacter hominis]
MNDRKAVKKTELPRRKKALRRTAAALALLVFMILTNLYGFLPIQALRNQEDLSGVRRTEILRRDYLPQVHPFSLFYLSCNKDVVMLTSMRWNLLGGWYPVYAPVLDCDGSEPVVSGTYGVTYSDSDQYILYVFGCVNNPDIASLQLSVTDLSQDPNGITDTCQITEFLEAEGHRVFAHPFLLSFEDMRERRIEVYAGIQLQDGSWAQGFEVPSSGSTSMG